MTAPPSHPLEQPPPLGLEWQELWDGSPEATCAADDRSVIVAVNRAFCGLFGGTAEEWQGRPLAMLPVAVASPSAVIAEPTRQEAEAHLPDGRTLWLEWSAGWLGLAAQAPLQVFAFRDATERRRMTQDLQRATRWARDMAASADLANAAKTRFLANISHEIRTPMNGILGMTELLRETPLSDLQREYAHLIHSSAVSLLTLLNDLLDFSKIEAGRMELDLTEFSLRDLLSTTLKPLALRASSKGITFSLDVGQGVPERVLGDATRLRQVLLNLVGNAVKFTQEGSITVEVRAADRTEHDLVVRFAVRDTGIGIPRAKQQLVFEPFAQADGSTTRKYGGSGLGLTICRRLVELMGGELEMESEENQGSTFRFSVCFSRPSAPARVDMPPLTLATPPRRALRVLLVEDNVVNQRVAELWLHRLGHRSELARNGREALLMLRDSAYDLVLMDVQMPDMDGLEATRLIRESERGLDRHLPIIAMTARAMPDDRRRCLEAGVDAYLSKPIQVQEFIDVINQVVPGGPEAEPTRVAAPRKAASPRGAADTVMDREVALQRVGGDEQLLRELCQLFLDSVPEALAQIRTAVTGGNLADLELHAHSLKGSVANFGAERTTQAAYTLEKLARQGEREAVPQALAELERQLANLDPLLRHVANRA